jgi:PDZ domain-containing secreted protein
LYALSYRAVIIHGSTTDQYLKKHLGDVIIAADGHNIAKSDDLLNYIGQHKIAGDDITLSLALNIRYDLVDFIASEMQKEGLDPNNEGELDSYLNTEFM